MSTPVPIVTEGSSAVITTEAPAPKVFDTSDKLRIINDALIASGNTPINIGDETSDEWIIGDSCFERRVRELLYDRDWNFATRLATFTRMGDSDWPTFNDIFAKPADCLFLMKCYRPDIAALIKTPPSYWPMKINYRAPDLDFIIIGGQIHTTAPNGLVGLYLPFPNGSQDWSVGFEAALHRFLKADFYEALNENATGAANALAEAKHILDRAASRADQEEPKKVIFRSSMYEARRLRRGGYGSV